MYDLEVGTPGDAVRALAVPFWLAGVIMVSTHAKGSKGPKILAYSCLSCSSLRHAALPKWLGWGSVLIGVVLLIGPIGWAAFIFATPIWTLIVSVLLYTRTTQPTTVAQPAATSTAA